jgi:hypothetical protein
VFLDTILSTPEAPCQPGVQLLGLRDSMIRGRDRFRKPSEAGTPALSSRITGGFALEPCGRF